MAQLASVCLCAAGLLGAGAAFALKESELPRLRRLLEDRRFFSVGAFSVSSGGGDSPASPPDSREASLSYAKFGSGRGRHGSLIFLSGKGENLAKYIELFYDLSLKGWSPIYTYDYRGQGFSGSASHAESAADSLYRTYRRDFEAFIQFVLGAGEADPGSLFLIAHSLGGAIALDYLQSRGRKQPFQAAALSAPMISVKSRALSLLKPVFKGYCLVLPCGWSIPSLRSLGKSGLTGSKIRYDFAESLTKEKFPQAASKGTSLRWLIESLELSSRLMDPARIQRLSPPVLILQSAEERYVSNKAQDLFCLAASPCCHVQEIRGKHELFMEADGPRDQAVGAVIKFFLNSGKHQEKCSGADRA